MDLSFEEIASFCCGTWLVIGIILAVWGWLSENYEFYGEIKDSMSAPIPAHITSLLEGKTKVANLKIKNVKILYLLCFCLPGLGFMVGLPLFFNPNTIKYHKNIGKNCLLIAVLWFFIFLV